MTQSEAIAALCRVLEHDRGRIARTWARRLRAELPEYELTDRELRAPLASMLDELARLLAERGERALKLWPEAVRARGLSRYETAFDASELSRELKVLGQVLLADCARPQGALDPALAELIAELIGDASIAVQRSYLAVARSEAERSREGAIRERVLQALDVGLLYADADGAISYVSPSVARLLELPLRSLASPGAARSIAAGLSRHRARHLDGRPVTLSELPVFQALRDRAPVRGEWMTLELPSGEQRLIEMEAQPLWEDLAGGRLVGALLTLSDRTAAARRTRELTQANDELRRRQGRLAERMRTRALGQLAVTTSHALNNLLNVLKLRLTLLRRGVSPEHLEALDQTARRLGELVSRLQQFAQVRPEEPQAGRDLDELVREAVELARPTLDAPDHPVHVKSQLASEGRARLDESFLRELLVDLLAAARDRTPAGGELSLLSRRSDGWVELRLDFPLAFGAAELEQLFDPLGKTADPLLSLLLAAARNQVQRWGGSLEAEPGAFVLRFPASEKAAAPEPEPVPAAPVEGPRRVLVVDDDVDNARLLAELLENEGYRVEVAYNGQEALSLWQPGRFDAGLLDVLLPDMSGWQLADELRRRSPHAQLAVVTGAEVRGQSRDSLALVDAVFTKPVDADALDEFLAREQAPA